MDMQHRIKQLFTDSIETKNPRHGRAGAKQFEQASQFDGQLLLNEGKILPAAMAASGPVCPSIFSSNC